MNLFKNELQHWDKGYYSFVVLAPNEKRAEIIHSIFLDYDIEASIADELELPVKKPTIVVGNIGNGIELPMNKLVLITENELFNKKTKRIRKRQKLSNAERIKDYKKLKVGDYIIHENNGVGKILVIV